MTLQSEHTFPEGSMASTDHTQFDAFAETCEAIIRQRPADLAEVIAAVDPGIVTTLEQHHQVAFYRGLGAGFADRYPEAQDIFAELLANPALADLIRGRVLNAAAFFAQHQGAYQLALDYYAASSLLWQRLANPLRQGITLSNRGILHYELQDYPQAEACLREAISLLEAQESTYHRGLAYNELGLVQRDQGQWDAALACFHTAEACFTEEQATDFVGRVANNIGEVEMLRGNLAAADSCFSRALALMETRIHVVDVVINRGLIAQAQHDHLAGLQYYQEAQQLAESIERRDILPLIMYRCGHAYQQLGQWDAALANYVQAIREVETRRVPLRDEGLLIRLLGR
jgi:tetratricopeptide (TPR) repeat protein